MWSKHLKFFILNEICYLDQFEYTEFKKDVHFFCLD